MAGCRAVIVSLTPNKAMMLPPPSSPSSALIHQFNAEDAKKIGGAVRVYQPYVVEAGNYGTVVRGCDSKVGVVSMT